MSLPRYFERAADALEVALGADDRDGLRSRLEGTAVGLRLAPNLDDDAHRAGYLVALNLVARLYPRVALDGPADLVAQGTKLATSINPDVEMLPEVDGIPTITFSSERPAAGCVTVLASGWNVHVDGFNDDEAEDTNELVGIIAGGIAAGELFRIVFAAELEERGRRATPAPSGFNVVTLGEPTSDLPPLEAQPGLGNLHLVGAGAVGQAAAYAFRALKAGGLLTVVDPEVVELSNLQRYVLTTDAMDGAAKVAVIETALLATPLATRSHRVPFEELTPSLSEAATVLVAVDSEQSRIELQATLPGRVYNAWTQPADIGWSRHERFGEEPCLACLYWPSGQRPSRHELIGDALRQPPARVLAYLITGTAVGSPLPPEAASAIAGQAAGDQVARWMSSSLLEDVSADAGMNAAVLPAWSQRGVEDLFREGICGGALLGLGEAKHRALVPLAHQSALAGFFLAAQALLAEDPRLRALRHDFVEARYDVLRGLPQVLAKPRQRQAGCICGDADFVAAWAADRPDTVNQ